MKTEQEQIEEIVKILLESSKKCFDTDCNNCDYQYEKDCAQYRKALALVQAGYGDVSEYKAEIERLKAEIIKQDQVIIERNFELVELEDKVKQAQIDVLKRLKVFSEPYPNSWGIYVIDVYHIDELIKEVENDK